MFYYFSSRLGRQRDQGTTSLKFGSSFLSTKHISLGANLAPKSFSETAPRALGGAHGRLVKALDPRSSCLGFDFRGADHV